MLLSNGMCTDALVSHVARVAGFLRAVVLVRRHSCARCNFDICFQVYYREFAGQHSTQHNARFSCQSDVLQCRGEFRDDGWLLLCVFGLCLLRFRPVFVILVVFVRKSPDHRTHSHRTTHKQLFCLNAQIESQSILVQNPYTDIHEAGQRTRFRLIVVCFVLFRSVFESFRVALSN